MESVDVWRIQAVSLIGSIGLFVVLLELIRRRRLKIQYSLILMAMSSVFLVLSIFRVFLERIAQFVGIAYAPSVLVVVAMAGLFLVVLHFSMVVSKQADINRIVAQEIGLLRLTVEDLEGQLSTQC